MEIPLFINSTDGIQNSVSHDFTISFDPEIILDKNNHSYIALDTLSMGYSWFNLTQGFNNNTLKYSHDGGTTWTTITIDDGNYKYKDLNSIIQQNLTANSHSASGITVSIVESRYRCYLALETNYHVDFRTGDFSDLIGFNKEIVTVTKYGSKQPNIYRSIDNLLIHSSIISDSIMSGKSSDVLYTFSVDDLESSFPFHKEGRRLLYSKINTDCIRKIRFYITDQNYIPVHLNNLPVMMTLLIKKGKKISSKLSGKAAEEIAKKAVSKAVEKGSEAVGTKMGEIVSNKLDSAFKKKPNLENKGNQVRELLKFHPLNKPVHDVKTNDNELIRIKFKKLIE